MWRRGDFVRFRARSRADRHLLIEAMLWLCIARSAILTIPFRWIARLFALSPGQSPPAPDRPHSPELVARIGWALRAAAARSPWRSTCLAQALAGTGMLRRRSIPGTLTMGVAMAGGEPASLEAHAWLSCEGVMLTGAGACEKYSVVAKFTPRRFFPDGKGGFNRA